MMPETASLEPPASVPNNGFMNVSLIKVVCLSYSNEHRKRGIRKNYFLRLFSITVSKGPCLFFKPIQLFPFYSDLLYIQIPHNSSQLVQTPQFKELIMC